jgi:hypothetical protein
MRVVRRGSVACKPAPGLDAASARLITGRIRRLADAGVRTPAMRYSVQRGELLSDWIDCRSALELLNGCHDPGSRGATLALLLEPLAALHRSDVGMPAPREFDPLRRVRPRLAGAESLARDLGCRLEMLFETGLPADCVVHGDFHVGQVLVDGSDRAWLIDFDDLALGCPEVDLGNFCAHLVTAREGSSSLAESWSEMSAAITGSYARLGPRPRRHLFDLLGAAALLRRALKLREQHRAPALWPEALVFAERLTRYRRSTS